MDKDWQRLGGRMGLDEERPGAGGRGRPDLEWRGEHRARCGAVGGRRVGHRAVHGLHPGPPPPILDGQFANIVIFVFASILN